MPYQSKRHIFGFTLIEVMIVMAIVAIVAAIALPSYQAQTQKTRRADCQAIMMQARQAMERFYTKRYTYDGATLAATLGATQCPIGGGSAFYNLTLVSDATTYTITATPTPIGGQDNDTCGTLSLNQAGVKTSDSTDCW